MYTMVFNEEAPESCSAIFVCSVQLHPTQDWWTVGTCGATTEHSAFLPYRNLVLDLFIKEYYYSANSYTGQFFYLKWAPIHLDFQDLFVFTLGKIQLARATLPQGFPGPEVSNIF